MKITIKENTRTNIKFTLHSDISFANSLRRILLGEVPSVAIDIVEIRENNSVLPDEMIAHRLGLVPITHSASLVTKQDCDCDSFCSRCSIKFTLKKNNDTYSPILVTGQDLVSDVTGATCFNSLIVKLAPKQKIDITCIATLGTPQTHVKHCQVTAVSFNYDPQNKTRATKLWYEQDVKKEWSSINQSDSVEWEPAQEIEMNVEVVEGMGKPKDILLQALEIYKSKMVNVLEGIGADE